MATAKTTAKKPAAKKPASKPVTKARGEINAPIMKWQYEQLIKELLLLQGHAADPTCPCQSAGEFCVRKHLLTIEALLTETAAMERSETMIGMLNDHYAEARELRLNEEKYLCGAEMTGKALELHDSLADWARMTRKVYEEYSLACSMKAKPPAPAPVQADPPAPAPFLDIEFQVEACPLEPEVEPVFEVTPVAELVIPAPAPIYTHKDLLLTAYRTEQTVGLNPAQVNFILAFKKARWDHARFVEVVRRLPYGDDRINYMEDVVAGKEPADGLYPDEAVAVKSMAPKYKSASKFASALYDLTLTDPEFWKAAGHDFPAPAWWDEAPSHEEFRYANRRALREEGRSRRTERAPTRFDRDYRLYEFVNSAVTRPVGTYDNWQQLIRAANEWFKTNPGLLFYYSPEGDGPLDRQAVKWHLDKMTPAPAPGLVAEVCSGLQEGKDTHVHFLGVPPDPKTGDHAWHRKWVDLYSKAQTVVGCSGGI